MHEFLEGFFLQSSLIFALGAQNIFVLESGLQKCRPLLVATICSICDIAMITLGVIGSASLFIRFPEFKLIVNGLGILFLGYYGVGKLISGLRDTSFTFRTNPVARSSKKVVTLAMGFSLLNPHVYLDAFVLIGGYSAKFPELLRRVAFGAGAGTFSVLWFSGLSFFAYKMSFFLNNSNAMRIISILSGIILLALAWNLSAKSF